MRYTDPTRIRLYGDKRLAASYVSEARTYLGALTEQLILGGIGDGVGYRQVTNAAGIVFRVSMYHGQPIIDIIAPGAPGRQTNLLISGFVTAPRTFGDPLAFGEHPEFILDNNGAIPDDDGNQNWRSLAYARYKANNRGDRIFPDGLGAAGTIDWRNVDQSIALTWGITRSRYWGTGDDGMGDPGAGTPPSCIYWNGAIVFDAYDLAGTHGGRWIAGAAVRGGSLLAIILESWSGGWRYRFVRAPLSKDGGFGPKEAKFPLVAHCKQIAGADMAVLDNMSISIDVMIDFFPPFNFNQAGTEARAISPEYASDFLSVRVRELIFDATDLSAVVHSNDDILTGISHHVETTVTFTEVKPNAAYIEQVRLEYDPDAPVSIGSGEAGPDGTWSGVEVRERNVLSVDVFDVFHDITWTNSTRRDYIPVSGTYTTERICTYSEYPCAVDYIDNVLTYAYLRLPHTELTSIERSGTIDQAVERHATGTRSRIGGANSGSESGTVERSAQATQSQTGSRSGSLAGLYCPRLSPETGNWVDLTGSIGASETVTASSTAAMDQTSWVEWDNAPDPVFADSGTDYDWSASYSTAVDNEATSISHNIWHLDLRFRSVTYTTLTETITYTASREGVGDFELSGFGVPSMPITETFISARTTARSYHTEVIFYDVSVDSWDGTRTDAVDGFAPTPSVAYTATDTNAVGAIENNFAGWQALADSGEFLPTWPGYNEFPTYSDSAAKALLLPGITFNTWVDIGTFPDTDVTDLSSKTDITSTGADQPANATAVNMHGASYTGSIPMPYLGGWIAFRDGWCFSMAYTTGDLDAAGDWRSRINDGERTLAELTGNFTLPAPPDLYSHMWPLSAFTFDVQGTQ